MHLSGALTRVLFRDVDLARLARRSCCQVLLGVLSLLFEKLTILCDSIGLPRAYMSTLHRSKIGIISQYVRLVISACYHRSLHAV